MVVNKAIKIFIEPDEEIVFIVEKVLNAPTNRLILIVPNTAALISSGVSLKILSREILKTDKFIVLVTDNEVAVSLGYKAHLIVKKKISEVNKTIWQEVKEAKEQQQSELDKVKKELLDARVEDEQDELKEIRQEKVKAVVAEEPEPQPVPEAEVFPAVRPRLKPRVVDLSGIKIFAGGDIIENQELLELERGRNSDLPELDLTSAEEQPLNVKDNNDMVKKSPGLIGQDFTKQLNDKKDLYRPAIKKGRPNFFTKIFDSLKKFFSRFSMGKILLGFFVAMAVFFGISYFFLTSVNITVELQQNSLPTMKTVTAKTDTTTFDYANLVMPAVVITKDGTTSSDADTTGTGSTGEYAQGQLLLFNTSDKNIAIKVGQVFSYNYGTTQLKYTSLVDATLPGVPPKTVTLNIKAASFGENYNITDTLKSFLTEGHPEITAQNVTAVTGGTTVPTKVVSKDDIDTLKASMVETLKTELLTNLKAPLSDDDVLLEGSEKYTEVSFTTSLKVGDVGDKFTADLKMSISGMKITKTDVKTLLAQVIKNDNGFAKVDIGNPVIENIKIADKSATFDVRANTTASADLNLDEIRNNIKGKTVTDAKTLIKQYPGVADVIIRFSPPFIPQAIQKIPTDDSKITLTKTNVTN
jgi:hypothetical protein